MNTTKATHTPGPWSVLDGAIVSEKLNDYGNFIVCAIQRELTEQDRANLSLIASAPELLEEAKDDLAAFEASFEHNAHETSEQPHIVMERRPGVARKEDRTPSRRHRQGHRNGGHAMKAINTTRCEVLWHYYDKASKRHVNRWLPAVMLGRSAAVDRAYRYHVRTDCGRETDMAAPECVRLIP
jgi:hypothetical protein